MLLGELLEKIEYKLVRGTLDTEILNLVYDSRKVTEGSVFVCIKGFKINGHDYAKEVIAKGAKALIISEEVETESGVTLIKVEDTRLALACMSAAFFGYPAEKLKTIGITGTKGKTTTSYMVRSILENAGLKTGLIGTIEVIIGDEVIPAANTTPESYQIQEYLAKMVEIGCKCVVMEVSSQGLKLHRVAGFTFDYGIFTNIEPDHIGPDEHKDFEEYMECKGMLFKNCVTGIANADDPHMKEVLRGYTCKLETYGIDRQADLMAYNINLHSREGSLGVTYQLKGLLDYEVYVNLPGKFSIYNSLTAIAICRHFDIHKEEVLKALTMVKVKGRVEPVNISSKFSMMIDYAHNAMSLESLLTTLKEYKPKRLVCLFGCGGNRSKLRRYEMGEISSNLADLTVVTSDNPRFEEPEDILNDVITGVKKGKGEYIAIIDRKEAIKYCIENAREGDVIVLAGKGHEDYQEIKGVKYKMDERDLIRQAVEEIKAEGKTII
ncbi:UDP-N-acetylmuramoyl-L-alanyl-D-glutamate--2,6-diaminopimelate ligase [Anaerocolumna xylanovorans]|uniref:UDP-N-acetylmuramoyl-L-alanyl-D-glutamate--2,6-diaminopimelate ligase n=1 Tax=Anaerocolumna xylanovorans DSM 12503 TaxID=1121345 RepID=A0A1M7YBV7_9FIRM|nr:UDP-N-acetylmuramoyl-L-alanyl-D-glutamate--2,6-diaminopimelate ligase [Anaerocolumna xylanovorans]SHO49998.1 UDP-N-acetylmuramoylalanyl-D-glutamate--2,6-diaminopimelate ligase [Anaerocolumna xylanovorans DSM 12503]